MPRLAVRSRSGSVAAATLSEAEAARQLALVDTCAAALQCVWQEAPSAPAAADYRRTLVEVVRTQRGKRPTNLAGPGAQVPFPQVGPYRLERLLGIGGNGPACLARHETTGQRVTLKLNSGAEGMVFDWFGGRLPPQFVPIYEHGVFDDPFVDKQWLWVAREYAPGGTWASGSEPSAPPPVTEAIEVFALACEGVAGLHANDVFGWSAHERNLLLTDREAGTFPSGGWRLSDLGRCTMAATADDERLDRVIGEDEGGVEPHSENAVLRAAWLDQQDAGPWQSFNPAGVFQRDAGRMRRLRLDDVAGLGGLLVDLLGVDRWTLFLQALTARPVCSGRYVLTGHHKRDRQLSRILNRAWLGDAGGALAVAASLPWTAGYDDALDLLADVVAAFEATASPRDRLAA